MNPLVNVLPPKVRQYVYAVLALAALVWGVYEASDGDWKLFVGGLIVALVNGTAASNTTTAKPTGEQQNILGKA
jgi:glucose dehydrogenase